MADTASQGTTEDEFTFASAASKEYPLAPEGLHQVIVARALFSMKDAFKPKFAGEQSPTVQLMLQSRQTYKDEESGLEKPYKLFKTMKISDHMDSGMFDFFQKTMGIAIPLKDKKIILKNKVEKVDGKDDQVKLPQFENLEFAVTVIHKMGDDGKKRDKIDSIVACSAEQKASNARLFSAAA